jgi:hypothetical protein
MNDKAIGREATEMSAKPYEYVNRTYGTNFKPGMRVKVNYNGKCGAVARKRHYTHYVFVRLDGAKHARPYHPSDLNCEVKSND